MTGLVIASEESYRATQAVRATNPDYTLHITLNKDKLPDGHARALSVWRTPLPRRDQIARPFVRDCDAG
jgi:hypothetical protein